MHKLFENFRKDDSAYKNIVQCPFNWFEGSSDLEKRVKSSFVCVGKKKCVASCVPYEKNEICFKWLDWRRFEKSILAPRDYFTKYHVTRDFRQ